MVAGDWPAEVAARIRASLPRSGAVVITGGTAVQPVYGLLARAPEPWAALDVFFSDERAVPPDHDASNFAMADRLLLRHVRPRSVHRMRGEDAPEVAAESYARAIAGPVREGIGLAVLGLGDDAHIAALFPGAPAVGERERLCVAVDRPDGLVGITLTAPALGAAEHILVPVQGEGKADAVARAVNGDEGPDTCPVRLLASHDDVTLLLDAEAARAL